MSVFYDASTRSYTLTDPRGSQTFRPQDRAVETMPNPRVAVYRRSEGAIADTLSLTKAGDAGAFNYRYVGAGIWRRVDTTGGIEANVFDGFTYGVATSDAQTPRTGTASFAVTLLGLAGTDFGVLELNGGGTLTFDFLNSTINGSGTLTARRLESSGYYTLAPGSFITDGRIASGVNAFTGAFALTAINTYGSGSIDGRLYGPNAEEVGAAVSASDASGRKFAGALIGRRGTIAPEIETLRNLFSPVSLQELHNTLRYTANANGTLSGAMQQGQAQSEVLIDPAAQSHRLLSDPLTPANRVDAESDARFTTYRIAGGDSTRTYRIYSSAATNDELVLSYATLGVEQIVNSDGSRFDRGIVLGIETLPDNLPRMGTGTYNGVLYGSAVGSGDAADRYTLAGGAALVFDWAGNSFTASLTPTATNQRTGAATALGSYRVASGSFGGARGMSSAFAGDIAGSGASAGAAGRLAGRFYGPTGQEVGATFSLTTPGVGTTLIGAGAIAAKR